MSNILSKNDLVEMMASELGLPDDAVKVAINNMVSKIVEYLTAYGEVSITGFGAPITVKQKSKSASIKADQKLTTIIESSKPGIEQRKLKRRNFILNIEVQEKNSGKILGDLGDITTEGIMLVSDDPITENKSFSLKIELPEEADEPLEIVFDAQSIRCQKTIHEAIFITGFKITALDEENREKIEYFIEEYAV